MKFRELKIDKELKDLLPPQTEEEHKILEKSILKDGCSSPIITWNDYIVDGHNRYSVCSKYNIGFEEIKLGYNTKDEIIMWMLENQLGRRNLSDVQRIIIAEKYRNVIETQAKENLKTSGEQYGKGCSNSNKPMNNPIDTKKELAKIAGVGVEKYYRTNKILKTDNEEIKEKLKNGDISVNKAYTTLFPKKEEKQYNIKENEENKQSIISERNTSDKSCEKCGQDKNINEFYIGHNICKECENKSIEEKNNRKNKDDDFNKLLERKYSVADMSNIDVSEELMTIQEDCDDFIKILNDRLFKAEKIANNMTQEDEYKFKMIMNDFMDKIKNILKK